MAAIRYTLLVIFVLLFSWPVLVSAEFSPTLLWLYPFIIWAICIAIAIYWGNFKSGPEE